MSDESSKKATGGVIIPQFRLRTRIFYYLLFFMPICVSWMIILFLGCISLEDSIKAFATPGVMVALLVILILVILLDVKNRKIILSFDGTELSIHK